jgi:spore maturation protein CgeB
MRLAILGLSITSSWGNGHATTYRALARASAERGHQVEFFERELEWYASNRDLPTSPQWQTVLYDSLDALYSHRESIRRADAVIVGSFVPEGAAVIDWVIETAQGTCAFYDIDTPVTVERLASGACEYLRADQVGAFDVYLSFTGGDILRRLEREFGARLARPLYCGVDPERYHPTGELQKWHLGYLGTYSADRQAGLDVRLLQPARRWSGGRFVVAGPQFPDEVNWPPNVDRIEHLSPPHHPSFYCAQRFTLNVTRSAMVDAGYSPSVRLFEAAACGTPVISDQWTGLETFFEPGTEILVTHSADETLSLLTDFPDEQRNRMAERARARVLSTHTAAHRARELEQHLGDARN